MHTLKYKENYDTCYKEVWQKFPEFFFFNSNFYDIKVNLNMFLMGF